MKSRSELPSRGSPPLGGAEVIAVLKFGLRQYANRGRREMYSELPAPVFLKELAKVTDSVIAKRGRSAVFGRRTFQCSWPSCEVCA